MTLKPREVDSCAVSQSRQESAQRTEAQIIPWSRPPGSRMDWACGSLFGGDQCLPRVLDWWGDGSIPS
jgi:hypothetical protein